ncbi:MAG: glycosyltransferase family 39 protein [Cyanobacteria bacterium J06642_12]
MAINSSGKLSRLWGEHRWAILVLTAGLLLRGIAALYLPAGFDEAYYYTYTQHPSLSYFDHPALVALSTGFGPWLVGSVSPFTIRLGPLLLFSLSLWLLYRTGDRLFGKPAGWFALVIATCSPIFQLGFGTLTLPDSPLILSWTACLYIASQEFFPREPSHSNQVYRPTARLAIASLLVGLACLGKYHGAALGFGLVLFCLLSHRHRRALLSKWVAVGVVLFAIALSPLLIWNAQHGWASFIFQFGRAASDAPYRLDSLLVTWLLGIAYLFPTVGFPMWWAIARASWVTFPLRERALGNSDLALRYQFLLCVSLPIIVVFTWMGGYRSILPTWPMPGFWGITLLLGSLTAGWWRRYPRAVWLWLWGSGLTTSVLMLVATLHIVAGVLQSPSTNALLPLVPVDSDASTELLDIEQIRQGIADSPDLSAALDEADFVATGEWFLSGYVAMAIAPLSDVLITCIGPDPRGFAYWDTPDLWQESGLYVATDRFGGLDILPESTVQTVTPVGKIALLRGGEVVEHVSFDRITLSPDI